jgi:hypothetical protein
MIQRIALVIIAIFALSACENISIQQGADGQTILTISLTEAEFNTILTSALANAEEPLVQDASVEFEDGQIIISGLYIRPEGGQVAGTATMNVEMVDGTVKAEIGTVDVRGIEVTDERIAELNQKISEALALVAAENNPAATLESISITDDALQIRIAIKANQQE